MMKKKKTAYDSVCLARDKNRPGVYDYIERLFRDFIELRGDRVYGDDKSMIALGIQKRYTVNGAGREIRKTCYNIRGYSGCISGT